MAVPTPQMNRPFADTAIDFAPGVALLGLRVALSDIAALGLATAVCGASAALATTAVVFALVIGGLLLAKLV